MIQAAVSDDKSVVSAEDHINARKQYEYYYIGDMSKTCVEYDSKNDEWPGLGVYAYKDIIRNNPVKLDSGMKYISKDVGHLRDMMPDTCGPAPVKEAWIWAILSTDTINEIVCELKKNGFFIVNYVSLQPDRIINQRQTDQEKGL
jgi:hypothetical protein